MNRIAELLPVGNVVLDVDVPTKARLFEQVGLRLRERHAGSRAHASSTACSTREKLGSTGLGQGIAIPHGRIKGLAGGARRLRALAVADRRSRRPTASPVGLVFVLLVPGARDRAAPASSSPSSRRCSRDARLPRAAAPRPADA
ncbi:MAG: PTS sugar transporter subunit IIA [Comamonadaceae bacterium]|nr:PTS sugar transporter subunit IIA [Comamonadaceae bacterium]